MLFCLTCSKTVINFEVSAAVSTTAVAVSGVAISDRLRMDTSVLTRGKFYEDTESIVSNW